MLHEFAQTTWLKLVERCASEPATHSKLVPLLDEMMTRRSNATYEAEPDDTRRPEIGALKQVHAGVHGMLRGSASFRHMAFMTEHRKIKGKDLTSRKIKSQVNFPLTFIGAMWTNLDPLTISRMSTVVHETLNKLLRCGADVHRGVDCDCTLQQILKRYGTRPFKCSFLQCSYRRAGFANRAERQAHEKHHDRPWRCSVPSCEYANGGFFSRRMRDDHLDRFHQETDLLNVTPWTELYGDYISLLYDLVQNNDVEAVKSLISVRNTPFRLKSTYVDLLSMAASQNSVAMLQLLQSKCELKVALGTVAAAAIKNGATEVLKEIVGWKDWGQR